MRDARHLLCREMRAYGQAEDGGSDGLRNGEKTGDRRQGTGISIRTAEVGWDGVVDDGLDPVFGEVLLQGVAPRMADDKKVPDGFCPRWNRW